MVSRKTIILFVELLMAIFLIVLIASFFFMYQKEAKMETTWEQGSATILESKLRVEESRGNEITAYSYALVLRYAYGYAGKSFEGNCTCFWTYARSEMNENAYRTGNRMPILINPGNPSESAVKGNTQPGKTATLLWAMLAIGLFSLGILELVRQSTQD